MNAIKQKDCGCLFTPRYREHFSLRLKIASWLCRIVAAIILLQTLYFKFSGAPESVYIFSQVGAEPWGRIGTGVTELLAAFLLILPRTAWAGGLLAAGIMAGAIATHLTKLGIVVQDDGGTLFALALIVFVCAAVTAYIHRRQIPFSRNAAKN